MPPRLSLAQSASKLYKENFKLKRSEAVTVLTDGAQPALASALAAAAKSLGAKTRTVTLASNRPASSPIPEARKALLASDVIVAPTRNSITHSPEIADARKNGVRVASMPGITESMFIDTMSGDATKVSALSKALLKFLEKPHNVEIRTPSGTHIRFNIQTRPWHADAGDITRPGLLCNVPFGEVFCAPRETVGQGVIAVDYWNAQIKPTHKATLRLKNGRISEWNPAASPLVRQLQATGTCGFILAELGIGINPAHTKPIGNTLYDEKILGTAHIAFGMNTPFGGKNNCSVHEDVVLLKPTIVVDGTVLMDKGKFAPSLRIG